MKKIVLLDLDDTLLNDQNAVTAYSRDVLRRLREKGIYVGYITSRTTRRISSLLGELPCDFLACYDGAQIFIDGRAVESYTIPYETAVHMIGAIEKGDRHAQVSAYFEPYCYWEKSITQISDHAFVSRDLHQVEPRGFQRIRYRGRLYDADFFRRMVSGKEIAISVIDNDIIIEHVNANKGFAARNILDHYRLDAEDAIAFGNAVSDIPMMLACETGVAVENACPAVREAATALTGSNNEDGVCRYLDRVFLGGGK